MNSLFADLHAYWSMLAAVFTVGVCLGATLAVLVLLARELCAAKVQISRRPPMRVDVPIPTWREPRLKGESFSR